MRDQAISQSLKPPTAISVFEAVGVAASIIQIVDLGKLSIQNVNQSIQSLSSDVRLTCATMRELGESLKDDYHAKLGSTEAYRTAQHALRQCEEVLQQIQTMIK
ncbi:hypothetical protein N7501_012024 [Penicillium viridicatum]|nr:hypothetical protein N7501_012024 [Penicillium viridicatum]